MADDTEKVAKALVTVAAGPVDAGRLAAAKGVVTVSAAPVDAGRLAATKAFITIVVEERAGYTIQQVHG